MKKILSLCTAFVLLVTSSNAAFTESKTERKEHYGAFKNAETKAAAELFVKMSVKDYEELTGKHLGLFSRAAFHVQQKRMKRELRRAEGDGTGAVVGFLAGLVFSLLGVLLVYLLSSDPNMRKWAWIGAAVSILIYILIII
jgi:hypothetical protein